jgi:iron complex outermembrane receptor protein
MTPRFRRSLLAALILSPVAPALRLVPRASAQAAPAPSAAATDAAAAPAAPVVLPTFTVSDAQDVGYVAANSVSATRIAVPIADLPFSVSSFTPQFITDIGATDIGEIARYAAGVSDASIGFNGGNTSFAIRGFVQNPQQNGFYESAQGNVYVDAVNIDRVEVVKGPASLLYGQISPGGTINYITKQAVGSSITDLTATIGSYNYGQVAVDVNRAVIPHVLDVRVVAAWKNDFQEAITGQTVQEVVAPDITWMPTRTLTLKANAQYLHRSETPPILFVQPVDLTTPQRAVNALNAATGYQPPSQALVNVTGPDAAAGYNDSYDPGFTSPYTLEPRNFNYGSQNDYRKTDIASLDLEADQVLGEHWVARGNYNYDSYRDDQKVTGVGYVYIAPPNSLVFANGAWGVSPAWNALTSAQQLAAEVAFANQLAASPNADQELQNGVPGPAIITQRPRLTDEWGATSTGQLDLVGSYNFAGLSFKPLVGLFADRTYIYNQSEQTAGTAASPYLRAWDVNPYSPTYYVNRSTDFSQSNVGLRTADTLTFTNNYAAYGLLNVGAFNNTLNLVGGVRYNRSTSNVINFIGPYTPGYAAHYTTPQVGLGYKLFPGILIYASYSESYTLPSTVTLHQIVTINGVATSVPYAQAGPTIGKGKEAGIKTDLWGSALSTTLSVYQITQSNVVATSFQNINGVSAQTDSQGGVVRGNGIEFEGTWTPMRNLQITGSVSEEDLRNIAEPIGLQIYLGSHPYWTRKTLANLWGRYTFTSGPLSGFWMGGGFNYDGKTPGDYRNPITYFLPAYTLWNSAFGYDFEVRGHRMSLMLNWNNMANTNYIPSEQDRGLPERFMVKMTNHF